MNDSFLDKVYDARDAASTRALYDDWSASYDAEVGEHGYATPGRCAKALADVAKDPRAPVLDFGCGTGLSGLALKLAGFDAIDGVDVSAEMIAQAEGKAVYRRLTQVEAGAPLAHTPGDYAAIAAIGVIGAGAAPISVFDMLLDGLAPGGLLVFSFNDHALEDKANTDAVQAALERGAARQRVSEYGPHLPGLDMNSRVYVLEKM